MRLSEKAYSNKWVVVGHSIIGWILFLSYMLEFLKHSRSLGYVLCIGLFTVVPAVIETILYRRDVETPVIKHMVAITYSIMYTLVIFTTTSILPFVYAFPMFIVITLYSDVRYCSIIAGGATLVNIANVVYLAVTTGFAKEDIPDLEIRMACVVLIGCFMVFTTYANRKLTQQRLDEINMHSQKTTEILDDVMNISAQMIGDIATTAAKMEQMGESVEQIHIAMGEVSQGSTETAESIQKQLEQTESIQTHILTVKDTTEKIRKSMAGTTKIVEEGKEKMDLFAQQVEKSMQANELVLRQMQELNEYTKQMNTIIETITSIANSTGMLALNASIEAARAGEAGRGFAVVADEISGLANQTKNATVNISELIGHINKELVDVEAAVNEVSQSNQENVESTRQVRENFAGIAQGTENIGEQTIQLAKAMNALEKANSDIVDKIQTISAITEEVSAHANETYEACEENGRIVAETGEVVKNLNVNAEKLKAAR